jgi:hypothetical protein
MKNRSFLLTVVAAVCLAPAWPGMAAAYIKAPPQTLGSICLEPDHICVLKVEKVNAERGIILFKHMEQLKGKYDGAVVKHVIRPEAKGAKVILDGATEGKTAVMFYFTGGNDRGHVYIDGYWYWVGGVSSSNPEDKKARPDVWWSAYDGEPTLLSIYCGAADKLPEAVTKILRGEEVVVPCMASDDRRALEEGRAKVQDVRASLKIVGADTLARIASRPVGKKGDGKTPDPDDKKPDGKKPDDKKPDDKKILDRRPDLVGIVKALSDDGKRFTVQPPPNEKNKEPAAIEIQIADGAKIMAGKEPGKLAVGQTVNVWLGKGDDKIAREILIGKLPEPPEKKPDEKKPVEKKADDKKPDLVGIVKALSDDGKRLTLKTIPTEKGKDPAIIDIQISADTKIRWCPTCVERWDSITTL